MDPDDRLLDLLDAWQVAFDRGDEVPPADLCRECPDLLPELERRVADLRRMARLAAPPADADSTRPSARAGPPSADTAGPLADTGSFDPGTTGFEIGEKLGGGGMGDVFRARDARLGRDVAVKTMKPELAADRSAPPFSDDAVLSPLAGEEAFVDRRLWRRLYTTNACIRTSQLNPPDWDGTTAR